MLSVDDHPQLPTQSQGSVTAQQPAVHTPCPSTRRLGPAQQSQLQSDMSMRRFSLGQHSPSTSQKESQVASSTSTHGSLSGAQDGVPLSSSTGPSQQYHANVLSMNTCSDGQHSELTEQYDSHNSSSKQGENPSDTGAPVGVSVIVGVWLGVAVGSGDSVGLTEGRGESVGAGVVPSSSSSSPSEPHGPSPTELQQLPSS